MLRNVSLTAVGLSGSGQSSLYANGARRLNFTWNPIRFVSHGLRRSADRRTLSATGPLVPGAGGLRLMAELAGASTNGHIDGQGEDEMVRIGDC